MIDDFLARWTFVRGMTTEFLSTATDECLDFRPGEKFMTIREQAVHLAEVQGAYQLAFAGEEVDFARKPEFAPAADDAATIIAALETRDDELRSAHGQWAAYAALGGYPTPTGWVMNWGLFV